MKNILFLFFAIVQINYPVSSVSAQQTKSSSDIETRHVVVNGSKMYYQVSGSGPATVILECGLGDNMFNSWDNVYYDISKFAKVVRYDRLGLGSSELSNKPRSLKQIASELHTMLNQANIKPPYVLAGHSMGGSLIRGFASLYKDEVAGLVLIDPFTEYFAKRLSEKEKLQIIAEGEAYYNKAPAPMKAEFETLRNEVLNNFPEINSFGPFPDVPTALLVAGGPDSSNGGKHHVDLYFDKMHQLSESRLVLLGQSHHYMQKYDPVLIVESIRRVTFPEPENVLSKMAEKMSADALIAEYNKMKVNYPKEYMNEKTLNSLGYKVLKKGNTEGAIKLFLLNVKHYPKSSNVYDSLGEAYMNAGQKEEAQKNYKKSLALNPENNNAVEMLKKLNQTN